MLDILGSYTQYFYSLLIVIASLIVAKIVLAITNKYVRKLTQKTKTDLDDLILEKIRMPIYYIAIIIGLSLALNPLSFPANISIILKRIMSSIIILFVAYMASQAFSIFIVHWLKKKIENTKSEIDDELLPISTKAIKVSIYILAILYILSVWGVEITPLLAGLGIAGLAVALALKDTLENVFSGISIIADRYFKIGDTIKLESGEVGNVTDVGLRSTKIRTFDNEIMIIPNSQLSTGKIINYAKPEEKARLSLDIGVEYGTNTEKAKKVILEVVKNVAKKEKAILTKNPEPGIYFTSMGDFALTLSLKVWVKSYKDRYGIKDKLNTEIYKALNKEKIGIPFPTKTIYNKKG